MFLYPGHGKKSLGNNNVVIEHNVTVRSSMLETAICCDSSAPSLVDKPPDDDKRVPITGHLSLMRFQ